MTCRNCDAPTTREYCSTLCHDIDQHPSPRDDMRTMVIIEVTPLDVEHVLDLMHNGFTREGACAAVAESHGYEPWGDYTTQLLALRAIQETEEVTPS